VSSVPEADVAAVHDYCANKIPAEYRNEVRLEFVVRGRHVTIYECRPPWNPDFGAGWSRQPVAQLRLDPTERRWALYCADSNGRGHNYPNSKPTRQIDELLAEVDADPTGIFWG
jgi:hypothetical protein